MRAGATRSRPVYESLWRRIGVALLAAAASSVAAPALAQAPETILDAREALRKRDRNRLAQLRAQAAAERHPLASWVDYWELTNRIADVQQGEATAFAERWPGSYVEDRFRNDWLLELGRRRDWANVAAEYPRFRMDDDAQVKCYARLAERAAGKDVKEGGAAAWLAQKEADDGCALLAQALFDARQLGAAEVWKKVRLATEANKLRTARQAAGLLGPAAVAAVGEALESPARFVARKAPLATRHDAEATTLALVRLATTDHELVAGVLAERLEKALPPDLAAFAWASVGRQAALKLQPEAVEHYARAERATGRRGSQGIELSDEVLGWKARAALRADRGRPRWQQVMQAITAMSPAEQQDPAWLYWKSRAAGAIAAAAQDGETLKTLQRELLQSLSTQLNYYGQLAAEDLGAVQPPPPRPAPLAEAERAFALEHPGLQRALLLIAIGLRNEGVREWNFSLRGMTDRELLAAAQLACDREVWDRCINTSDRSKAEVDLLTRFPTPLRNEVVARARDTGLDPAYVYGLIRQESRFIMDARSSVGASGLMQLMPATARWTAKRIGLDYSPALITDRDTNLRLGNAYLKLVLDDLGGSQPMAAAAYNAGPGRPRTWRAGPVLDADVWVENIPFGETRDYVKKVLSNAAYYAAVMGGKGTSVRARLGKSIGPADPAAPSDRELP